MKSDLTICEVFFIVTVLHEYIEKALDIKKSTTVDSLEVTMSEAIGYFQTSYVLRHFDH